jgi:dTDP-glucose 4,6-dehydratase/UDP-glucose 4-epimerase
MGKKYLVTGGTGFIGSSIVKRLVMTNNLVRVLDNNSRGALSKLGDTAKKIEFVEADIRDFNAVQKAADGMDCIIHLAYVNGTEFFYTKPELVLDIGIRGILNVIDACRSNNIGELILASSSEVYQTPPLIPADESVPLLIPNILNPRYSYGGGKILSELVAINYGRNAFERVMIFRPHNVYGPDMGYEHVLPQFITRIRNAMDTIPTGPLPFPIQGDGSQTRAFIYIDDFVDGFMCMLKHGEHLNIYNIGNPEEIAIRDVTIKIARYLGREINIINGPLQPGSTARRCPNIQKLTALGFKPQVSFDQGLPVIIDWYMSH